jgi:asparagine synthetase B (glutamine-hydrolysing)
MCGLFGAVGHTIDPATLRELAILNESRGRDSTGFFTSAGEVSKDIQAATVWLRHAENRLFLDRVCDDNWAVCGHTRSGTRGSVCQDNAHPFEKGEIVGAHNGAVASAPATYAVDSMWLFELLSQQPPGAYQAALGAIPGWYMLTYLDKRDQNLYFLNWTGSLHLNFVNKSMYYSSEAGALWTATGEPASIEMKSGDVRVINLATLQLKELPAFTGGTFRYENNYQGWRSQTHPTSTQEASATRFDRSLSGKVAWFGPAKGGGWFAHQRNDVWRVVPCQKWLNRRFKDFKGGVSYTLNAAEILQAMGKETQDLALTKAEERERMQEQGMSRDEIDYAIEKGIS